MPAESSNTPVAKFFKPYTSYGFYYNPAQPANKEFRRLYKHMGWQTPRGIEPCRASRIARFQFGQALIQQFQESFGKDVDSLDSWQALCAAVYIDPVPDTLEEAQIAFERTHVNLLDLTENHINKREIKRFPTVKALSEYTKGTGRFFPRDDVQEGGLLCHLLRHINNPRIDDEALKNGGRRLPGGKWRGRHAKREGGWR
ncbi:hypothetical protein FA13DRAFT_1691786 [Coprinellus micaceus]|uniref:Uncharacterized protein n=1 Tax=Coprinellus micaceus TaxID=71717 RepID=A0A4Y7SYN3_COPMI|nr:hypothetical protein FA13DRAFT_1691786 [Coprinellus micaceus]